MLKHGLDNFVLSTRVRLARNLAGIAFEPTLDPDGADALRRQVGSLLGAEAGLSVRDLDAMSDEEILALKEQHLISETLIARRAVASVALNADRTVAVMLNEEDHIRIQSIIGGLELEEAYERARAVDETIGNAFRYAYDERLGFLTTCPTNLGTGMRASVMMFLPGIRLTGGIDRLGEGGRLDAMTFRGVYGEGSQAEGFLYQLSNKHTLGLSEQEIIANVKAAINRIAELEERARDEVYRKNKVVLTDRIYRAWGLLTNSYTMTSGECVELIAYVKLGVGLGLIRLTDPRVTDRLLTECRPATLTGGKPCSPEERDLLRAQRVRTALENQRIQ